MRMLVVCSGEIYLPSCLCSICKYTAIMLFIETGKIRIHAAGNVLCKWSAILPTFFAPILQPYFFIVWCLHQNFANFASPQPHHNIHDSDILLILLSCSITYSYILFYYARIYESIIIRYIYCCYNSYGLILYLA